MSGDDPLDRLARLAGIEPRYTGFWGDAVEVPSATKRALLRAMGHDVDARSAVEDAARLLETRPWRRALAPVAVIAAGAVRAPLAVTLPAGAGARLCWRIAREDGGEEAGEARVDALALDARGEVAGRARERRTLLLPALPPGYHAVSVECGEEEASARLIAAPQGCRLPRTAGRCWGIAVQAYSLRQSDDWGIGDLSGLAALAERAAAAGAAALGVSPLHPLYPANPWHASPYSPSSRAFLNVLHLSVPDVIDVHESEAARALLAEDGFRDTLARLRAEALVDHAGVAAHKLRVLGLAFESFRHRHLAAGSPRAQAFRRFCAEWGAPLERLALFDALQAHFVAGTPSRPCWRDWPAGYRGPDAPQSRAFAASQRESIEFHCYLQWLADGQLAAAAGRARDAGMPVGLYLDIAAGVDPGGGEAWSDRELLVADAAIGAPPDEFNRTGQDWGLAPANPATLRARGYQPFARALGWNMRHAGLVRLDHVMGLMRLYWIPRGARPTDGAYVRYPLEDLLGVLALESHRNRCAVVGEDLGTVPDGLRDTLAARGVHSCRVLYFERWGDGLFRRPETYPAQSLVSISTHDLPPLAGWWAAHDVDARLALGLFRCAGEADLERERRAADRRRLVDALVDAGVLAPAAAPDPQRADFEETLLVAVHRFAARTPGWLLLTQIEDLLGLAGQPNLPGTVDEHPNWRRRLPWPVEDLLARPAARRVIEALRAERSPPAAGADAGADDPGDA